MPQTRANPTVNTRGLALIIGAGAAYFVGLLSRRTLMLRFLGTPDADAFRFLASHAIHLQLLSLATLVPAILLLGIEASRPPSLVRDAFQLHRASFTRGFIAALVLSVAMNWTGVWPFTWRSPSNTAGIYTGILLEQRHFGAIAIWAVTTVAIVPLLEEVVFRVGLLRTLHRVTSSSLVAVLASSLLFAMAHLGHPFWQPDAAHLLNAFWLFIFSLIIGHATVRDGWSVSVAMASHVSRNAVELVLLSVATLR